MQFDAKLARSIFQNDGKPSDIKSVGAFVAAIDLSVHDSIKSIKRDWLDVEKTAKISVYQRYDWVQAYLNSQRNKKNIQPFVIVGRYDGDIVFILPCEIRGKFFKRLKFIGGSHVNFNLCVFSDKYRKIITPNCFAKIFDRVRKLVPGIGYVAFCCQPESWLDTPNPMLGKHTQLGANPTFLLNLEGGFDATLARGNAKRKRKKFRHQCRQVEAYGGYELVRPENPKQAEELITIFLDQKSKRLKQLGVRDVFADESVHAFLTQIVNRPSKNAEPLLQLYALKIGNDIAAIFGGGIHNKRLSGFFSSINTEKFIEISPGEMLLYLVVQDACAQGLTQIDLGAGDERYKHSWSSETIDMYDVIMPFNGLGMPIVTARRWFGAIRRYCRQNQSIWNTIKKTRQFIAKFH